MNWRSAKTSARKSAALILLGLAFVFGGRAQSVDSEPAPSKDHALFEVNLHSFGYDTSSGTRRLDKFVDFTDSGHLALAWLTLDDPTAADKIGPLTPRPAHLHVIVLDAQTGQKQGLQDWSTPSTPVRFLGLSDGKFITCTGNVLRLLSPGFEAMREQNLVSDRACLNTSFPGGQGVSPSRRSLLLSSYSEHSYQNELLDLETFALIGTWTEEFSTSDISDHWMVAYCGQQREVCLRGIDQPWRTFRPDGMDKQMTNFRPKSAVFVNDETLVIEAWNKMAVATVDGTLLFQVELPKNRSFGRAVTSSGGERFAVIENRQRGLTNEFLDMYAFPSNDRVVVYSIPDRRAIYAVKVNGTSPWAPWETHRNQLALSPDGVLLAVVSDGILKVYRLPDSNSR